MQRGGNRGGSGGMFRGNGGPRPPWMDRSGPGPRPMMLGGGGAFPSPGPPMRGMKSRGSPFRGATTYRGRGRGNGTGW